ncbi:unnamed protein product [Albugo candida]|uniref:Uncharacterized protein n=1 Tax=Albugo candida TaxID=65357 RepID=A0A024GRB3_9STRA|nr:unnamed protein product [Albugo candida]|eukprot:CCI48888.1 unnamed protein product [Albugo candida]
MSTSCLARKAMSPIVPFRQLPVPDNPIFENQLSLIALSSRYNSRHIFYSRCIFMCALESSGVISQAMPYPCPSSRPVSRPIEVTDPYTPRKCIFKDLDNDTL